jgi:hypothetical protein
MQKRPAMFGIQRVEDILLFSSGYATALDAAAVTDEDKEYFSNGFMRFVLADYNAPAHCNWCMAIRLYSASDSASVELCFEELAKFKSGETDS